MEDVGVLRVGKGKAEHGRTKIYGSWVAVGVGGKAGKEVGTWTLRSSRPRSLSTRTAGYFLTRMTQSTMIGLSVLQDEKSSPPCWLLLHALSVTRIHVTG